MYFELAFDFVKDVTSLSEYYLELLANFWDNFAFFYVYPMLKFSWEADDYDLDSSSLDSESFAMPSSSSDNFTSGYSLTFTFSSST